MATIQWTTRNGIKFHGGCLHPGCEGTVCVNDYTFHASVCDKSVCKEWFRQLQEYNKVDSFVDLDDITTSYYSDICHYLYNQQNEPIETRRTIFLNGKEEKKTKMYYYDFKYKLYKTLTTKQQELAMEQEATRWAEECKFALETMDKEITQLKRRRID